MTAFHSPQSQFFVTFFMYPPNLGLFVMDRIIIIYNISVLATPAHQQTNLITHKYLFTHLCVTVFINSVNA